MTFMLPPWRASNVSSQIAMSLRTQEVAVMLKGESPLTGQTSHDSLETVLSRAFQNEPSVTYVFPDEATRQALLPLFFRSVVIPATQMHGEVCMTPDIDGTSLWISPGRFSTFASMMRSEMQAMRLNLEARCFRRWINLSGNMERVHNKLTNGPHWYLLAHGHDRSETNSLGGTLVERLQLQADRDRLPCYVENFREALLPVYEEHGFQIVGAGQVPRGGPSFWAMIRTPR
jgi:hypothetical protein